MPFPLGHTAIGLATYESIQHTDREVSRLGVFVVITFLANLPDVDIILGLVWQGNGNLFHRGPTHSLAFAILAGYGATHLWRLWGAIPRLGFPIGFGLVFSHVLADMAFTTAPVSLLWPFQVFWSAGFSDWETVARIVLFDSIRDGGIIAGVILYLGVLRLLRTAIKIPRVPAVVRRRSR